MSAIRFVNPRCDCDGRSSRVQQAIVNHNGGATWAAFCAEVKGSLYQRMLAREPLNVRIFCNHGKHRSVGSATVLSKVLFRLGYQVTLDHISLFYHRRTCNCSDCCDLDPVVIDFKRAIVDDALDAFNNA